MLLLTLFLLTAEVKDERFYNRKMANCLEGRVETRLKYKESFVLVDIETETHLIEAGLDDRRSSLDSVQQAMFFHILKPSKKPMIIIYDRDGREGKIEYQLRLVSERLNIAYYRIPVETLNRDSCHIHLLAVP